MNVLSLFDGMSCGQIALNRLGIKYDKYFASELDKYAIETTQYNYPNTIQLGDVINIKGDDLPKIDLLIGGSPCQGFSNSGKLLNFEDPRSKLFFEYVRLLKECKPTYFLLENVKMKKEYEDIITEYMGVQPIEINSALVSAQTRKRLYWTNIPNIEQPKDKKIKLQDIIEDDINIYPGGIRGRRLNKEDKFYTQMLEVKEPIDKSNCITRTKKDNVLTPFGPGNYPNAFSKDVPFRFYTINEICKLQNVDISYFPDKISNTQRLNMLGNGWTVDVIVHIFKNMTI